jgi:hypothetical protein
VRGRIISTAPSQGKPASDEADLLQRALGNPQFGAHHQRVAVAEEGADRSDVVADDDAGYVADQDFSPDHEALLDGNAHRAGDGIVGSFRAVPACSRAQALALFGSHFVAPLRKFRSQENYRPLPKNFRP